MEKPYVIRYAQEEPEGEDSDAKIMVDRVVTYFTRTDPERHRSLWKKRRKERKEEEIDRYYI